MISIPIILNFIFIRLNVGILVGVCFTIVDIILLYFIYFWKKGTQFTELSKDVLHSRKAATFGNIYWANSSSRANKLI